MTSVVNKGFVHCYGWDPRDLDNECCSFGMSWDIFVSYMSFKMTPTCTVQNGMKCQKVTMNDHEDFGVWLWQLNGDWENWLLDVFGQFFLNLSSVNLDFPAFCRPWVAMGCRHAFRLADNGLVVAAPPCSLYGPACQSVHQRCVQNPGGNWQVFKVRLAWRIWTSFVPWQSLTRIHLEWGR